MKSRTYILALVLVIAVVSVRSCCKAGSWLVKEDELEKADAIVILMGSISDRVLQVADLYHQKYANKVLVVEASMGTWYREFCWSIINLESLYY